MSTPTPLPLPTANQATISLTRLSGGNLRLPSKLFIDPPDTQNTAPLCPSMSWLLTHPSSTKLVFDLGLRKDRENYPPGVWTRLQTVISSEVDVDAFDSLAQAGVDPEKDVDVVLFSHLHYDHVGDPSRFGDKTKFIVGPGAKTRWLSESEETFPSNEHAHYDSNLLPADRTIELPVPGSEGSADKKFASWEPLGPFPAAIDYFDDGSLFIVDAPGHLTGHINLLARVEPNKWVLLAGDSAHDIRLYKGSHAVAVYTDSETGRPRCAHADKEGAERHVERVRELEAFGNVEIILAHDWTWLERNPGRFAIKGGK